MDEETKKILEESTKVAKIAAGTIGGTFEQGKGFITGDDLTPSTPVDYETPPETPVAPPPPVPAPTPPVEPTPQEKNISDLIAELTAGPSVAGEKAAFEVEQEEAAGLGVLKQAEQDYTAQLSQIEAEFKNVESRMQIGAEGRGITKAGLAPITMAEQRKLSIRANTVGALLAAAQGKVTFAQSQIDTAVKNKFAQAEAERTAKIENLALLLKDPNLTIEQKNRADAQKAKLEKEKEDEATKKADTKTVMDWATKASANGATPEQAQTIMDIALSDDPDLEKAFELFAPFSAKEEKPTGDVATFKQFFPDVDVSTPEGQQQYLNWKARTAAVVRAPKKIEDTYGKYSTRLNAVVNEVYSGRYGKEGSREQAINILQGEFPDKDISKDIYTRIPDGYEAQIKVTTDVDKEETVWAWLATPEAQALSDDEKKGFIMSYGLNPDKFNIY